MQAKVAHRSASRRWACSPQNELQLASQFDSPRADARGSLMAGLNLSTRLPSPRRASRVHVEWCPERASLANASRRPHATYLTVPSQGSKTLPKEPLTRCHRRLVAWVYILRCADDALYIGLTDDLETRLQWHHEGRGSNYTRSRRPVALVYSEPHRDLVSARTREQQLKRWSRAKKDALIAGSVRALKAL
jgi:putative endonuclease